MLATRLARERGFDEALLVTPHGRVLEAPTSSIFWAGADGVLCTPPLDEHILASITRAHVMELVEVAEAPAHDRRAARRPRRRSSARRRARCSRSRRIEEHEFGDPGPRTLEAAAALRDHIRAARV